MAGLSPKIIFCIVVVNICLSVIGTLLKNAQTEGRNKRSRSLTDTMEKQGVSPSENPTEPYIVPKLHNNPLVVGQTGQQNLSTFKRFSWGDSFLPNKGAIFPEWRDIIPEENMIKPDFVFGIPTIKRQGAEYLYDTIASLINNLGEKRNAVLLVSVGSEDEKDAQQISESIRERHPTEMATHMIQVISPPKNYYPDWKTALRPSLGDSYDRIKWRSKQSLDQVYLMMYAYYLQPKYYLMLEDDIIASKDYLTKICADVEGRNNTNYILVSYCQLGGIGKLFRRSILPSVATFLALFWSDKPMDWLLLDYTRTRVCNLSEVEKECVKNMKEVQIVYKPSLFQHVGKTSSLTGKTQTLQDKSFRP